VKERPAKERPAKEDKPQAYYDEIKHRFDVVYELDGRVEGYAVYGVDDKDYSVANDNSITFQCQAMPSTC